jgi:DNA polymerase, archaea type
LKLTFWLLDINPQVDGEKIQLWLWGIDQSGHRVLIIEKNFSAYFYATLLNESNVSMVIEEIKQNFSGKIKQLEIVERRYFGKSEKTIKIYCKNTTETSKLAKFIRSIKGIKDCFEDDIRIVMRYLTDNILAPCSWHEVEVVEEKNLFNFRIDQVYTAITPPKKLEKIVVPELRVVSFSIIYYSLERSPKSNRNPVLIISTVASNKEERQFVVNAAINDKSVIEAFIDYIREFDPDIIVSFGANSIDWTYLRGRCHTLGIHLDFDRAQFEPHTSVYGHVSITGIANVDLADFMDIFPTVKVKTLWNLSNHLGILKDKVAIDDVFFTDYWDDTQKREELKRFGIDSARKISGAAGLLLDFAMQLSTLTTIPLDQVMTAAVGFRVEWFLIKQAQKNGELIPKRVEQPYVPYVGGLVLSPKSGLHENIAMLDFKSMYPNIMLTYNLSPDTYLELNEPIPSSGVFVAPEVGHRFRKSPPGFYKAAIMHLINIRNNIRQQMKELDLSSVEYQVLNARQKAVKIITNAVYGYAGWIGARWYIKPVAEAASAWGRDTIQKAIEMTNNAGIEVIYGDTTRTETRNRSR